MSVPSAYSCPRKVVETRIQAALWSDRDDRDDTEMFMPIHASLFATRLSQGSEYAATKKKQSTQEQPVFHESYLPASKWQMQSHTKCRIISIISISIINNILMVVRNLVS